MRRLLPASVRGQAVLATAIAMTIFGVAIAMASYILVSQVSRNSEQQILSTRLAEVADGLRDHGLGEDDGIELGITEQSNPVLLQVIDSTGAIAATTPGLPVGTRLCPAQIPEADIDDTYRLSLPAGESTFVRHVEALSTPSGPLAICAAVSRSSADRAQSAVLLALLFVLPLLIAGVCLAVWLAVGRALRAVDDLRTQAESMNREAPTELEVQPTGDEVEHLGRTLNTLLGDLHQQSATTRRFVADAGHELRNPLTTLRLSLEFGSDGDEEELRAALRDALADLDRLESLVQELLALARSDAMDGTTHFEPVELSSVVLGAVDGIRRTRPEVDLEVDVDECTIDGDETGLRSLAVNLCDNAARHAVGRVTVRLTRGAAGVVLQVDDDGVGVPAADCDRVFDRFVRLDEARVRDEGGSGLGLAIVSSVAAMHGARASARPGPGGHFEVVFPLTARGPQGS